MIPSPGVLVGWIGKARILPPSETVRRGVRKARTALARWSRRRRDHRLPTHALDAPAAAIETLFSVAGPTGAKLTPSHHDGEVSHYLLHEFDLLGSGQVRVAHGLSCAGFGGHRYGSGAAVGPDSDGEWLAELVTPANAPESRRIWSLVDPGYVAIDWQRDFKSGWRWSERTWYRDIAYGTRPGVDVKVPWELARLQHLPRLALGGAPAPEVRAREFRNEALDFIATNPPRFGVNWVTAMDVAIRAVNLLVAHDLFLSAGSSFDAEFEHAFARSILEHGRHITANLEWDPDVRGNHYLADICGLAFIGAYLRGLPEADGWLDRAVAEFGSELRLQFNPDGTSFEGSTSYHRLSTEMAVFTAALVLGLPAGRSRLPADTGDRIARMIRFTRAVRGPDGRVAQVGDNDSGRFLALTPSEPSESLDHGHLLDAAAGLIPVETGAPPGPDQTVVGALAGGARLDISAVGARAANDVRVGNAGDLERLRSRIHALPAEARAMYLVPGGSALADGLELEGFPDGGYWIARSRRMHLVIRCGPIGQRGRGGHDHDDQLSFSLSIDGRPVIADPGTYVYTPLPAERNAYRSARNHSGPLPDGPEPADLDAGLFVLTGARPGECVAWGRTGFGGFHRDRQGRTALALIEWVDDGLRIEHGIEGGALHPSRRDGRWETLRPAVAFSPGYGLRG